MRKFPLEALKRVQSLLPPTDAAVGISGPEVEFVKAPANRAVGRRPKGPVAFHRVRIPSVLESPVRQGQVSNGAEVLIGQRGEETGVFRDQPIEEGRMGGVIPGEPFQRGVQVVTESFCALTGLVRLPVEPLLKGGYPGLEDHPLSQLFVRLAQNAGDRLLLGSGAELVEACARRLVVPLTVRDQGLFIEAPDIQWIVGPDIPRNGLQVLDSLVVLLQLLEAEGPAEKAFGNDGRVIEVEKRKREPPDRFVQQPACLGGPGGIKKAPVIAAPAHPVSGKGDHAVGHLPRRRVEKGLCILHLVQLLFLDLLDHLFIRVHDELEDSLVLLEKLPEGVRRFSISRVRLFLQFEDPACRLARDLEDRFLEFEGKAPFPLRLKAFRVKGGQPGAHCFRAGDLRNVPRKGGGRRGSAPNDRWGKEEALDGPHAERGPDDQTIQFMHWRKIPAVRSRPGPCSRGEW